MAHASVEVPAALVGAVRDTAGLLYDATVEALHFALRSHVEEVHVPSEEVVRGRERLADLDALLARLGWWGEAAPVGDVELSAPRDVLHDVLYGTLIEAGERLAAACGEGWRGGSCPGEGPAVALGGNALGRLLGGGGGP